MLSVDRELDRVLTLLRNKIRERGFTQLEVQEALSWGRSPKAPRANSSLLSANYYMRWPNSKNTFLPILIR